MDTVPTADLAHVLRLLSRGPFTVLTGAGLSTDSGIPDYRGPGSKPRNPMTYQQFIADAANRRRYWARNHVGWRHMHGASPNPGHRALAELERQGRLTGLITQNVDRLHSDAGSRRVIDLHGRFDRVRCLDCGTIITRQALAVRLEALNPHFGDPLADAGDVAPDADMELDTTEGFVPADCGVCGGTLKPDVVFFGENVPKDRVAAAYALVDAGAALLVAGSSLTVMSGYRFVRHAAKNGIPVVIINRGPTRGDGQATIKLDAGTSTTLEWLAGAAAGSAAGGVRAD